MVDLPTPPACADGDDVFDLREEVFRGCIGPRVLAESSMCDSLGADIFLRYGRFDIALDGFLKRTGRRGELDMDEYG